MKKLKFKTWLNLGDVLTIEELKHVFGGIGSGSGEQISCFCIYTKYDSSTSTHPYETSIFLTAYTPAECKNKCDSFCRDSSNHASACEAVCGYSMCEDL